MKARIAEILLLLIIFSFGVVTGSFFDTQLPWGRRSAPGAEPIIVEKITTQLCTYPQPPITQDIVNIDEAISYLTFARDTHWYFLTERTPPGYPIDPERERLWIKRYQAIINLLESMREWYPVNP